MYFQKFVGFFDFEPKNSGKKCPQWDNSQKKNLKQTFFQALNASTCRKFQMTVDIRGFSLGFRVKNIKNFCFLTNTSTFRWLLHKIWHQAWDSGFCSWRYFKNVLRNLNIAYPEKVSEKITLS